MTSNLRQTFRGYSRAAVRELYEGMIAQHAQRLEGLRQELASLQAENERMAAELARSPLPPRTTRTTRKSIGEGDARTAGEGAMLAAAHEEANALVEEQAERLREQRMRHEADKERHARLRADALVGLERRLADAMGRWSGREEEAE